MGVTKAGRAREGRGGDLGIRARVELSGDLGIKGREGSGRSGK